MKITSILASLITAAFALGQGAAQAAKPISPMYVTTGSGTILVFTAPDTYSVFATGLDNPSGIAIDRKGNVFVAEHNTGRILKFTAPNVSSIYGTVSRPGHMALDGCGNLFVASVEDGTVLMYTGPNQYVVYGSGLSTPVGVTLDSQQRVVVSQVADNVSGSVVVFSARNTYTTYASNVPGVRGISMDSIDNLYLVENSGSGSLRVYTAPNNFTYWSGPMTFPYGAFVGPSDVAYVADTSSIIAFSGPNTSSAFAGGLFYPNAINWEVQFKKHRDCSNR